MTTDSTAAGTARRSIKRRTPMLAALTMWFLFRWHRRLPWGQSRPPRAEYDSLSPTLRVVLLAELALEWLGVAAAVYGVEIVALAIWVR
jgi:hypothetical protein